MENEKEIRQEEVKNSFVELQQELFKMNSELLMIFNDFKNILSVFEKSHNCKIVLQELAFYKNSQKEVDEWKTIVSALLDNSTAENYFDFKQRLETYMDYMEEDINLTTSCASPDLSQELIEYQYSQISRFIEINKLVLDNIDKIIENIKNL